MRAPRTACVFLIALGLAACGPNEQQVVGREGDQATTGRAAGQGGADVATMFDPCAGRGAPADLCGDPEVAKAAAALAEAFRTEVEPLSMDGRRIAAEGARSWIEAQAAVCRAEEAPAQCLSTALGERLSEADGLVEVFGDYTVQRVEMADSVAVTSAAAAQVGFAPDDAPGAMLRHIRYPRIDNPARDPAIDRFNALVTPERTSGPQDLVEEDVGYDIAFAGPGLISVRFRSYEYALGAAHPNANERAVTVLLPQGALLRPETVFRPRSGWEQQLEARAMKGLEPVFEEFSAGPPDPGDVRDTATKAHNWVITEDALVVLFPPYSVGPFALGGHEVAIPWTQLRTFTNPDAPAPIGQGQG